jgi:hypothetical protein
LWKKINKRREFYFEANRLYYIIARRMEEFRDLKKDVQKTLKKP